MTTNEVLFVYAPGFQFSQEEITAFQTEFPNLHFTEADAETVTDDHLEKAEILCGYPHPESVRKAVNMRWLQLSSIGVDKHIHKELYVQPEAVLTNCHGNNGLPISDHVLSMILLLSRNLHYYRDQQNARIWAKMVPTKDLFNSSVLVIGLGSVGSNTARKCNALGMKTMAVDIQDEKKPEYVDILKKTELLDELLPQADFVVLTAPSTPETYHIMNSERFQKMKRDAYLINVSRGALVDTNAFIEALQNGIIAGAAVDVFDEEPLPVESPLWGIKNVFLTPHVAGKSPSAHIRHFNTFHDNLIRYLKGEPLNNVIDFSRHF